MYRQIMTEIDNPVLLLADLDFATEKDKSGRAASIPILIYRPTIDRSLMERGNAVPLGDSENAVALIPISYSIESGKAESTAIDHISKQARSVATFNSAHTSSTPPTSSDLPSGLASSSLSSSSTDSNLNTLLSTQKNALDMLAGDLRILTKYVSDVIDDKGSKDEEILHKKYIPLFATFLHFPMIPHSRYHCWR